MAISTAKGSVLKFGNSVTPFNFSNISQCRSFAGPTVKPVIQKITTHDTPGFWHRSLATLVDAGTVSFDINFDFADATHSFTTGMWSAMVSLLKMGFNLIFPNNEGQLIFDGYFGQHEFTVPVDNVLLAKIQIAITDAIRAEAGSST